MPPLNRETLRQIATGDIPDKLKFVRFGLVARDESSVPLEKPVSQIIYFAEPTSDHALLPFLLNIDLRNGKLGFPNDLSFENEDAGRIRREDDGTVVFYDYSLGLGIGADPAKREATGRFVQDAIADPNLHVLWEMPRKP